MCDDCGKSERVRRDRENDLVPSLLFQLTKRCITTLPLSANAYLVKP